MNYGRLVHTPSLAPELDKIISSEIFCGVVYKLNHMGKICTIVGARPQFIKVAPLSRALRSSFEEILVHTGQHYDAGMSEVFFEELGIPKPHYHLGVGGGTQGAQTGRMLIEIEKVFEKESPEFVIVIGDTNSTLAGALVASKLHLPVAHVEAGLRSFNRRMPEEINRVLTDHISKWLFTPSQVAIENLKKEGITEGVYDVGDIMYDAILSAQKRKSDVDDLLGRYELQQKKYFFTTIHRAENTDDRRVLHTLFEGLQSLKDQILLPLHPRTKKRLEEFHILIPKNCLAIAPLGYLDTISLMSHARAVLTDSGGIQKEAYYLGVPCITLREETEWIETSACGWNFLVGHDIERLQRAVAQIDGVYQRSRPQLYGSGDTAQKILKILATAS